MIAAARSLICAFVALCCASFAAVIADSWCGIIASRKALWKGWALRMVSTSVVISIVPPISIPPIESPSISLPGSIGKESIGGV